MATRFSKVAAVATAATVVVLTASPAQAATVAQADASAIDLKIGGNSALTAISSPYTCTHDGTKETTTGTTEPVVEALEQAAVLNQDANCLVQGRNGISNAEASVTDVGVDLSALDLGTVQILGGTLLAPLADALEPIVAQVQQQLLTQVQGVVNQVLDASGIDLELGLDGVVARCNASPGQAAGSTDIASLRLFATVGGQELDILDLGPISPPPNTEVIADLDVVLNVVLDAVRDALPGAVNQALGPIAVALGPALDAVQQQLITGVVGQVADGLAPLQDLLRITLNQQTRPEPGRIEVNAIRIKVLEAAEEAIGFSLIDGTISHVGCGPNSRVGESEPPTTAPPPTGNPPTAPPTKIPSGADSVSGDQGGLPLAGIGALGGLLLLSVGAGYAGYRRSLES